MKDQSRSDCSLASLLFVAFVVGTCLYFASSPAVVVDHPAGLMEATPRSGHWPKVRADHLAKHPACEVCGNRENVDVHHCQPYHLRPDLECDPDNLITLCRDHHLLFGHLGSWTSWNKDVREDAAIWRKKIEERP